MVYITSSINIVGINSTRLTQMGVWEEIAKAVKPHKPHTITQFQLALALNSKELHFLMLKSIPKREEKKCMFAYK